jgi:hypothetical protein
MEIVDGRVTKASLIAVSGRKRCQFIIISDQVSSHCSRERRDHLADAFLALAKSCLRNTSAASTCHKAGLTFGRLHTTSSVHLTTDPS